MAIYDEVNGVARKIIKKYDGVNGIARKIYKFYDGVNDIGRLVYSDNSDSGEVTTVNIAGHIMTSTSANPVLYYDSGSGMFTLDGVSYSPTYTYTADAIPLLGAPDCNSGSATLTAGGTYYYSYFYDDGSYQFAVMINQKGNITWERASAGCFDITWTSGSSVQIGGSFTEYYCDTAFVGLSVEDDNNATSDGDIPYGTNVCIGMCGSDASRSYVYYLYDDTDIEGGGSDSGGTTTVTVYDASGALRGTLQTTDTNPTMKMEMYDSGELYLKGGVGVQGDGLWYYEIAYGQGINIAVNAWRPVGLSVANDGNITSDGDLEWNTDEISLEAGKTYTYYTYGEDDLQSGGDTIDPADCAHANEYLSYSIYEYGRHIVTCSNCGGYEVIQDCTSDGAGSCIYCYNAYDG